MRRIFISVILIISIFILLTGCNSNSEKTLQNKTNEEIDYIKWHILTITNKYAKGEYNEGDEFLWEDVKKEAVKINNEIDTIMLDFSEYNISQEELINFRDEINNLIITINDKDEDDLLSRCSNLYSLLTKLFEKSSTNNNKIKIMELSSLTLLSYNYSNSLEWEKAKQTIDIAVNKYSELFHNVDAMKEYSYNLNKIYILLEEMKNAVYNEELELVKIKYVAIIEEA